MNSSHSPARAAAIFPRGSSAILALLCVGGAVALGISQETPLGKVKGRVVISDGKNPLPGAQITLTSDENGDGENPVKVRRIRAVSDKNGEFWLPRVAAGAYHLSATSRAHASDESEILVTEDEISKIRLTLKRSEPDLKLTQQQSDFLPSETVIVPVQGYINGAQKSKTQNLRVRIFQTRLSEVLRDPKAAQALGQISNRYETVATLPTALLKPTLMPAPRLVKSGAMPIQTADIEGFFHERLKFPNLKSGLYLVEIGYGKNAVCAQMSVSDTALVVKKSRGEILAYAVDSQSGAPRKNAQIQLFQAGKTLAKAQTDAQGLARIALKKSENGGGDRLLTLASFQGNDATVGQYDYSDESDESNGDFRVHAYTDRPIYRPGGRVSFKGIARRVLQTSARFGVPKSEKVAVEVRDPSGGKLWTKALSTNDFGSFGDNFELSPEAPTGNYSVVMTFDGDEEHTANFNVASYRKPEFSATVSPNQSHYAFGEDVEMMVAANYYFGAPVAGAKIRYSVYKAPDWSAYYGEESDESDDEDEAYNADWNENYYQYEGGEYGEDSGEAVHEGTLKLDANGSAVIRFNAPAPEKDKTGDFEAPQDQIYSVQVTIEDAAQRFIEASGEVPVTAGDFRLTTQTEGYFAVPGKATTLAVFAKNFEGKAISNAPIELVSNYYKWNRKGEKTEQQTRTFRATTDAAGVAKIQFTPSREGVLNLRAVARDDQNRAIVATRSLWVSGDAGGDYDAQYGELSLLTDKKRYQSGEVARVLLNAEKSGGTALVSIEGSKLFRAFLVPLEHKSTAFQIPIGADYGPNISLVACMVRDKKFARSEVPLRVSVPARTIKVKVSSDRAKYRPGERATYSVQTLDFKGRPVPAEVSFGVVDESIYALQEDDRGALRRAFYPQNPNNVQTGYSFEPLYLGDVNKDTPTIEARKKFLDTAFWQSDLRTDESGKASVSFVLPDNLTTWRATAVAQTLESAFGRREQKVVVAKDFFVRLEAPRFFTMGDQTQITALVHNESGAAQSATVSLEADGLALDGEPTQNLQIAPGAVGQIVWPVATDKSGVNFSNLAKLKLSARTQNPNGARLTDAVETQIPVRARGREKIENFVGTLQNGAVLNQKLAFDSAAIPATSRVSVRITPTISDALVGALPYLVGFPYGCTEQTMSRFLPDILVQRTLRLRGANDERSQKLAQKLPAMVRDGLTRLARMQHESGGWGWWEADEDDAWMTAYVLYGLAQAQKEGYDINPQMLDNGRAAAAAMLRKTMGQIPVWQQSNWHNTRAFTMYSLALAGPNEAEMATLRNQRAGFNSAKLTSQSLGYLVLLDAKLGLEKGAWAQLEAQMDVEGDQMIFWKGDGRDEWADWNDKTATALGLSAMVAQNPSDERIGQVLLWLMAHRQDDTWGNTRDTAWILGALCDYLNAQPQIPTSKTGAIEVALNGKPLGLALENAPSGGEMVWQVPSKSLKATGNTLQIARKGAGEAIFYAIQVRQTVGSDAPLPPLQTAIPIQITREFRRILPREAGADPWKLSSAPTQNQLKQGERIRVRLTLNVPRDLSYVLIEDAFPSGCEVTERGSAGEGNDEWDHWWSSTDVRDDRIAFFARHMSAGQHTVEYNLRAQTPGDYKTLPTLLQAMYAPEVRAESGETLVSIR